MSTAAATEVAKKSLGEYEVGDTVANIIDEDVKFKVLNKDGNTVLLERLNGKFVGKKANIPAASRDYVPVGRTATRENQVENFGSLMGGDKKTTEPKAKVSPESTKAVVPKKPAARGSKMLTGEQVAKKSGVTPEEVAEARKSGALKGTNVGATGRHSDFVYHPEAVTTWLQETRKERKAAKTPATDESTKATKATKAPKAATPAKTVFTPTQIAAAHTGITVADVRQAIRDGELTARNNSEDGKPVRYTSTEKQVEAWLKARSRRTAKAAKTNEVKAESVPGDFKNRGNRSTDDPIIPDGYQRAKGNTFEVGGRNYVYLEVMRSHRGKVTVQTLTEETAAMRKDVFGVERETYGTVHLDLENKLNWWTHGNLVRGGGIIVEVDSSPCQMTAGGRYRKNEKKKAIVIFKKVEKATKAEKSSE